MALIFDGIVLLAAAAAVMMLLVTMLFWLVLIVVVPVAAVSGAGLWLLLSAPTKRWFAERAVPN